MAPGVATGLNFVDAQFRKNWCRPAHSILDMPNSRVRFSKTIFQCKMVTQAAVSMSGSPNSDSNFDPYELLGVSHIQGFAAVKAAYKKKHLEAESIGDRETASRLELAYDKVMMLQLTNRKKGLVYGSHKVTKDIKYADKLPLIPWGPRFSRCNKKDMAINFAISITFVAWILVKRNAGYNPLQFMALAFLFRFFKKLKAWEPSVSQTHTDGIQDDRYALQVGKRFIRSVALVIGCIAAPSLAYTGILNLIELLGRYIPVFIYGNQELLITTTAAIILWITASYYR